MAGESPIPTPFGCLFVHPRNTVTFPANWGRPMPTPISLGCSALQGSSEVGASQRFASS
jgi:hypothetical protein